MDTFIDHDRDMTFSYAAVKQLEGKYLVQNRVTGEIYESAQFLYILVAACLFSNYPRETRLQYVKRFYDAVSTFKISLPTPIMSACVPDSSVQLLRADQCGDNWIPLTPPPARLLNTFPSVPGSASTPGVFVRWVLFAVAKRSIPVVFRSANISRPVKSLLGAAWRRCGNAVLPDGITEVGKPAGVEKTTVGLKSNRVRHMDYGVQINKLMYTRLLKVKISPCSAVRRTGSCTTRSSPIRKSLNVCIPNMRKTTASASGV